MHEEVMTCGLHAAVLQLARLSHQTTRSSSSGGHDEESDVDEKRAEQIEIETQLWMDGRTLARNGVFETAGIFSSVPLETNPPHASLSVIGRRIDATSDVAIREARISRAAVCSHHSRARSAFVFDAKAGMHAPNFVLEHGIVPVVQPVRTSLQQQAACCNADYRGAASRVDQDEHYPQRVHSTEEKEREENQATRWSHLAGGHAAHASCTRTSRMEAAPAVVDVLDWTTESSEDFKKSPLISNVRVKKATRAQLQSAALGHMERLVRQVRAATWDASSSLTFTMELRSYFATCVREQVQQTQKVLGTADAEWSDIANTLDELAHAIESLGLQQSMDDVARQLAPISSDLCAQVAGFKSKLVGQVCKSITRIVKVMKRDFGALANELLPSLVNTAKGASTAVRQPGAALFVVISEHVRYDLHFFGKIFVQSHQERIRLLMLEQLAVVLACWSKEEIEPYYGDVVEIIRRGLQDPIGQVRGAARDSLCSFAALWKERVDELVDIPSGPARDLLLKEKPHAVISLAILKKYPELQKKASQTEVIGKKIARQRSLYQKAAPTESQEVEVLVAKPPGTTRVGQDFMAIQNDTVAQNPSIPRRLFQDDESEQMKPSVTTISGILRRSPLKAQAIESKASRTEPQPPSTGIPVPPASTRPDENFHRSRIEAKAEGSKIPPPSTKSPILRSKATSRVYGTSRSQDSPPVETKISPSQIPKPTGTTSVSMGNFKLPSKTTSKDSAGQENMARVSNFGDRFLDSPIPSSESTPTPVRFDNNVTVRARRKLITTSSDEENKMMARDSLPVPVSHISTSALEDQPSHEEEPIPATDITPHAPLSIEQSQLPNESQRLLSHREMEHIADEQVFDEADIEETMLISRDVTAQDYVEEPDVCERVSREEETTESLTSNALENLRDIQEKMARMQALTRLEIRGIPMKQRASNSAEIPHARPRSAGRTLPVFSEPLPLPQALAKESKIETSSNAPSRQAGERDDFLYQTLEFSSPNHLLKVNKEFTSDVAEQRAIEEKKAATSHESRLPVDRRIGASRDYEVRQPGFQPQRRRAGKQMSAADTEREQVERQFQGLVRESHVSNSRPSPAERQAVPSGTSKSPTRSSSEDHASFPAPIRNENRARGAMKPPLQHNVKPASTTTNRESVAARSETRSRAEPSQLPGVGDRSGASFGDSCTNQSHSERTTKHPWVYSYTGYFCLLLGFIFGASGLMRAATTVRDTHDYHQALKMRIGMFEASISESYDSVRKLEENYAVWSEYVRVLAEEDETHALSLLETIQHEVEKWQVDMKHDLTQFKKSLSVDVVEAALVPLLKNATEKSDL